MKVYAKIRQNGEYHSQNISQAVYGFREIETLKAKLQ